VKAFSVIDVNRRGIVKSGPTIVQKPKRTKRVICILVKRNARCTNIVQSRFARGVTRLRTKQRIFLFHQGDFASRIWRQRNPFPCKSRLDEFHKSGHALLYLSRQGRSRKVHTVRSSLKGMVKGMHSHRVIMLFILQSTKQSLCE
jgi:hypothetical protein